MRRNPASTLAILLLSAALAACASTPTPPAPAPATETPAPPTALPPTSTPVPPTPTAAIWQPSLISSWQIQYTGEIDTSLDVDIYNLDLFDTSSGTIAGLHTRGIKVMCYFSAGTFEDWRPDVDQFPASVLGNNLEDWPGEKWLDIRSLQILGPIMLARLDLARQKGCDGVDPDNVDTYTNDSGFPLTAADQLAYNIFLAEAAHQRGLAVGLKNDLEQIPELVGYFDWAVNEECFTYEECDLLLPFIEAGKPVFMIEYEVPPDEFCPHANELNFNAIHKTYELDAYRTACR